MNARLGVARLSGFRVGADQRLLAWAALGQALTLLLTLVAASRYTAETYFVGATYLAISLAIAAALTFGAEFVMATMSLWQRRALVRLAIAAHIIALPPLAWLLQVASSGMAAIPPLGIAESAVWVVAGVSTASVLAILTGVAQQSGDRSTLTVRNVASGPAVPAVQAAMSSLGSFGVAAGVVLGRAITALAMLRQSRRSRRSRGPGRQPPERATALLISNSHCFRP